MEAAINSNLPSQQQIYQESNSFFEIFLETCDAIFLTNASLLEQNEKTNLENTIKVLKTIPSLSQEERMNWQSWYRLHFVALEAFLIPIHSFQVNFLFPLPWHPMQIKLTQFFTNQGLHTSCEITQQIAFTKLLGAKDAALFDFGKSNHLNELALNFILKNQNPLLLAFRIDVCDFVNKKGHSVEYAGHTWTVFQANPDLYLMINSYLDKQNPVVMELNANEMQAHIQDMHAISNSKKWTKEFDGIYNKWFGASHLELIGLKPNQENPWQVTFKSVMPNIHNLNKIQEQFSQALVLPYFPQCIILEKDEKIPIDNEKIQKFNDGKFWWCDIVNTISLTESIYNYTTWKLKTLISKCYQSEDLD